MDSSLNKSFVLKLFNLQESLIESFHIQHVDDTVVVNITLTRQPMPCPVCDSMDYNIKDYTSKSITHSALKSHACILRYRARRFICRSCKKTFYENNPFTLSGMKISLLTVYNVLKDLKSIQETFKSVANRHFISPTTAMNIFDKYVDIPRYPLPKILCIDEVFAFKSEKSKYVCVLVDYLSGDVIDLLPSRHKHVLSNYFYSIPIEERNRVKIISIDMWHTYRSIAQTYFRNALVSIDKFHVLQEFSRSFTRIRIDEMNKAKKQYETIDKSTATIEELHTYYKYESKYYVFKKFHWLLNETDLEKLDPNIKKRFNRKLNRYLNFYDLLDIMLEQGSPLEEAYNLKSKLRKFYELDKENPVEEMNTLIHTFEKSNIESMNKFADTLKQWKQEILNSFINIKEDIPKNRLRYDKETKEEIQIYRVNNGIIENRNKDIKTLKRHANGFDNWERFRNRVIYALNEDANHRLYPIEKE